MLQELFQRFARYNAWANRRLYAACAELDPAEYHRQRPAFFGSIHRTLNHILVADRLWVARARAARRRPWRWIPSSTRPCPSCAPPARPRMRAFGPWSTPWTRRHSTAR
jgi:hypothetical protein